MKTKVSFITSISVWLVSAVLSSCSKNALDTQGNSTTSSNTIAVAASLTKSTAAGTDSVYVVQPCRHGDKRDSIAESALPSSITTYISTNYSGAVFSKAFELKNSISVVTGYVVIIYYNDQPVALQFDANGNFAKVLEQRERGDIDGPGFHHGGCFDDRDGKQRDSIALSLLPSAVTNYFSAHYASDTLLKAFRAKDSSVVVLSKNNGLYATVFDASGNFVKRVQCPAEHGNLQSVDQWALPVNALDYLTQTYPNYVFKKAFSFSQNGVVEGYVVLINANSTKYAVEFNLAGTFVRAKPIY